MDEKWYIIVLFLICLKTRLSLAYMSVFVGHRYFFFWGPVLSYFFLIVCSSFTYWFVKSLCDYDSLFIGNQYSLENKREKSLLDVIKLKKK